MTQPRVTVVVVPRERFSETRRSLESVLHHTPTSSDLVYVDGGSPPHVARYLRQAAGHHGFRLLRHDRYLTPNEARNLGAAEASSPYLVFLDNDAVVWPGWLEALVACADETHAWVVGPVVCIGPPGDDLIHVTRGEWREVQVNGGRRLDDVMVGINERLRDLRPRLARGPCDFVEFHCMLVRRDSLERLGGFDEGMRTTREHIDFCLAVRQAGGTIYFEPQSCVTHVPPWCSFELSDLSYFLLRWNDDWARESIAHFQSKWNLPAEAQDRLVDWVMPHRRVVFEPLVSRFRPRIVREHIGRPLVDALAATLERSLVPLARRRGRRVGSSTSADAVTHVAHVDPPAANTAPHAP